MPSRSSASVLLRIERLEDRQVPTGLSLVANWNEGLGHRYADGWAEGNYAYIGHFLNQGGVDIIDISDPTNPVQVANFQGSGDNEIRDLEVQNGIGFFASDHHTDGGVYIVDLHDPTQPVELARITPTNGGAAHVHTLSVDGDYLYEADSTTSIIRVFNVSNPANPVFHRSINSTVESSIHEVTAQNGRLYTASIFYTECAEIFDISNVGDLSKPVTFLGIIFPGDHPHTSWPTDDNNWVAITREESGGDLSFWDIRNPANPKLAWRIQLPPEEAYSAHQVMIQGDLLYVAWYQAGVRVYNIANRFNPILVGSYDTFRRHIAGFNGCWGIYPFLGTDRILAFDKLTGLYILSLTREGLEPTRPGLPAPLELHITPALGPETSAPQELKLSSQSPVTAAAESIRVGAVACFKVSPPVGVIRRWMNQWDRIIGETSSELGTENCDH